MKHIKNRYLKLESNQREIFCEGGQQAVILSEAKDLLEINCNLGRSPGFTQDDKPLSPIHYSSPFP